MVIWQTRKAKLKVQTNHYNKIMLTGIGFKKPNKRFTEVFRTTSNSSNWCFNRFRLYTANPSYLVQARKTSDGSLIGTQRFREPNYPYLGDFEASFVFDFSWNVNNEEISIYISDMFLGDTYQQCYAYTGHAGTATRWGDDPNITEYIANCQLKFVNIEFLRFDYGDPNVIFVYFENQGIYEIQGADKCFAKTQDWRNNNIPATTADQLIIGADNNGVPVGTLLLAGNNGRTSASDAAWTSLQGKGWTLSI